MRKTDTAISVVHACAFSVAQSCLTLHDPHGLQPARLLYLWDYLGKNTGVGCHFLPQESSQPRNQTHISCISSIARWVLYHCTTWEAHHFHSVQFSSVSQSCPTVRNPMDRSTPGLPIHCQLPEFIQTHLHWVSDAIQLCHPLWSPSPPAFNLSQHQMSQLFASAGQIIGVSASTSVLPVNTQDWFPLGWTCWIFLQSKGLSRVFFNTRVQKHQFFSAQLSLSSNSHIHTWLLEKP